MGAPHWACAWLAGWKLATCPPGCRCSGACAQRCGMGATHSAAASLPAPCADLLIERGERVAIIGPNGACGVECGAGACAVGQAVLQPATAAFQARSLADALLLLPPRMTLPPLLLKCGRRHARVRCRRGQEHSAAAADGPREAAGGHGCAPVWGGGTVGPGPLPRSQPTAGHGVLEAHPACLPLPRCSPLPGRASRLLPSPSRPQWSWGSTACPPTTLSRTRRRRWTSASPCWRRWSGAGGAGGGGSGAAGGRQGVPGP